MPVIPDDLVTAQKAAGLLAVHVSTVYRLIRSGRLRAWKRLGGRVRVSRAETLALLEPVEVRSAADVPRGPTHEEAAAQAAKQRLAKRGYKVTGVYASEAEGIEAVRRGEV